MTGLETVTGPTEIRGNFRESELRTVPIPFAARRLERSPSRLFLFGANYDLAMYMKLALTALTPQSRTRTA